MKTVPSPDEARLPVAQREVGAVGHLGRQRGVADLEGEVPGVGPEVVELLEARVAGGAGQVQRQRQVVAQVAEDARPSPEKLVKSRLGTSGRSTAAPSGSKEVWSSRPPNWTETWR